MRTKCDGFTAAQMARRPAPPSTASLLGLLCHLAETERDWRSIITDGTPLAKIYGEREAGLDNAAADRDMVDAAWAVPTRGIARREILVDRLQE